MRFSGLSSTAMPELTSLGAERESAGETGRADEGCGSTDIERTARADQLEPRNKPIS